MSRNFELLSQVEFEPGFGTTGHPTRTLVDRVVVREDLLGATDAVWQEEMLRLVQIIYQSTDTRAPKQLVFCGVEGDSGSSAVCASAGRILASKSTESVCLVDANMRMPRLSCIFGIDSTTPDSPAYGSVREQCVQIGGKLWLAGTNVLSDPRGGLQSTEKLKHLLAELSDSFSRVLIDAPGTSVCADAQLLGQMADAAVLVIEANSTRRLTARKAKETLDAAGVRMLGTVLHNRSFPIPQEIYKRL